MASLKKTFFRKLVFLFFILWIFGILFTAHPQASQASDFNKVILLVWDGAQRNHLNELLTAGKLPNLQELINEGRKRNMRIFTQNCSCVKDGDNYHTETGPGHAAMLTGYGFPQMKNHANGAREEKENDCPKYCPPGSPSGCFEKLGPNPVPRGRTLFERLKEFNPAIKTGLITGKNLKFFPFPALKHAAPSSCCGTGGCGDGNAIDTCHPSNDTPKEVTPRFLWFLEGNKNSPFFLFAHYKYPDSVGHNYGEDSQEYSNALIEDDRETGRIIQKLKNLGIYEKTVILVTTDHGFIKKGHHACVPETKDIWIVSNRKNVIDKEGVVAKQTSIVPTIFDIFGMDKNVTPPFAGKSLYAPSVIPLSSGWNQITWPDIQNYTAKSALEDIDNDCGAGTSVATARKRKDWWEGYVAGFGGENFNLQNEQKYFINVSKSCSWVP